MYCTQQQLEDYLGEQLTSQQAALFPALEAGVARQIDAYCTRTFEPKPGVTSQIYDGGDDEIFFDTPVRGITKVEYVDSMGVTSLIDPSSYYVTPYNDPAAISIAMRYGHFARGHGNIKVTGTFSEYDEVPADITLAATILCAHILTMPNGGMTSESIEGYTVKYEDRNKSSSDMPTLVTNLLDAHRRVLV